MRLRIHKKMRRQSLLGLDDYENVNYLRAIKRVIGMERVPVYRKHGAPTRSGVGAFARVLTHQMPNLPVEDEARLNDQVVRERCRPGAAGTVKRKSKAILPQLIQTAERSLSLPETPGPAGSRHGPGPPSGTLRDSSRRFRR